MNPLDLPEIFTADLTRDDALRLLRDVRRQTELLGLTFKGGVLTYAAAEDAAETRATLDEKLSAVISALAETTTPIGIPHGLQLRYAFGGVVFYDTLIQRGDLWRLTRIAPPHAQPR